MCIIIFYIPKTLVMEKMEVINGEDPNSYKTLFDFSTALIAFFTNIPLVNIQLFLQLTINTIMKTLINFIS